MRKLLLLLLTLTFITGLSCNLNDETILTGETKKFSMALTHDQYAMVEGSGLYTIDTQDNKYVYITTSQQGEIYGLLGLFDSRVRICHEYDLYETVCSYINYKYVCREVFVKHYKVCVQCYNCPPN